LWDCVTLSISDGKVRFSSVRSLFCPNPEPDRRFGSGGLPEPRTEPSVQVEKGQNGAPDGLVSSYLRDGLKQGDILEIGMPFGTLKLAPTNDTRPLVLIAGGIGCTVTVAMLSHIIKEAEFSKLYHLHAVRDGGVHAYRNRVARFQWENSDKVHSLRVYSKPRPVDRIGVDYDIEGRVNIDMLKSWLKTDLIVARYVLCGPDGLVHDVISKLLENGVTRESIQFECFGPLVPSLDQFA